MKNFVSLLVVLALLLAPLSIGAQAPGVPGQAVPVYSYPQRLDVTTNFWTVVASATTLTITPPANQFLYITAIEIMNCAGAAVTGAAPLSVTSTGLGGGITPVWTVGTTSTAGICNPAVTSAYYIPIKSNTAGANVTFVTPTFTANQTIRVNIWGYYAP